MYVKFHFLAEVYTYKCVMKRKKDIFQTKLILIVRNYKVVIS